MEAPSAQGDLWCSTKRDVEVYNNAIHTQWKDNPNEKGTFCSFHSFPIPSMHFAMTVKGRSLML